jgi:hypothetical protein
MIAPANDNVHGLEMTTFRMDKAVLVSNIKEADRTYRGRRVTGETYVGHNAEIVPGSSIRLHGIDRRRSIEPTPYDRTFHIGDQAEHGSYNLSYYGPIVAITAKSVTIRSDVDGRNRRLSLAEFSRRNWNFDLQTARRRNGEWMD